MNFLVLKCFQCHNFQVHQSKKSKKWICKVCGEKQSLVKVYFEGLSRECRQVVQDSNFRKSKLDALVPIHTSSGELEESYSDQIKENNWILKSKTSKWEVYKSLPSEFSSDEENNPPTVSKRNINSEKSFFCTRKRMKKEEPPPISTKYNDANKVSSRSSLPTSSSREVNSKWNQFRS